MITALLQEMQLRHGELVIPISSVYFGGGTPSLLSSEELEQLISATKRLFTWEKEVEVTLEANPDDISKANLEAWHAAGINRLSVGIQSLHDELLQFMNRTHNAAEALEALSLIKHGPIQDFTLDLIYGIPGQSLAQWERDIHKVLDFNPPHISSYCLTIEEDTVFGRWSQKGKLNPLPDEDQAAHYEKLIEVLVANGYEQYEVSNFAKEGHYAHHNSQYWKQAPYLGIGPGAHSYNGNQRSFTLENNALYIKGVLNEGKVPQTTEDLSRKDKINEYLMTHLRTKWGLNFEELQSSLGYDILADRTPLFKDWQERKLCEWNGQSLVLTSQGKLLADALTLDLFLD